MRPKHPWQARLSVGTVMLFLAFLGMVITDVRATGGFDYWKWIVPIYAILALWLSWYIRRKKEAISPITLGHEFFHWIGLILAVFMVSYFVRLGIISRFIAGIFDLTLLGLAVFLAGIYIEFTFILIGLILGAFALLAATVVQYFYAILVPLFIGGTLVTALSIWIVHKTSNSKSE